jgi:hypothetical protein
MYTEKNAWVNHRVGDHNIPFTGSASSVRMEPFLPSLQILRITSRHSIKHLSPRIRFQCFSRASTNRSSMLQPILTAMG